VADAEVKFVVEQALCGVVVGVHDNRGEVQFIGALGDSVAGNCAWHE
jgi:hypothetical protein